VVCYIAHKGGVCVREASRLEQPVHSAVAETRLYTVRNNTRHIIAKYWPLT
jgi:hypothetical protein